MSAGAVSQNLIGTKYITGDWLRLWLVRCHFATSMVLMRCVYVARLVHWAMRHRSIETARWVVAYEGRTW